jgi:fused signal recognition particle receptor
MFDNLKKKIGGWFGKKDKEIAEAEENKKEDKKEEEDKKEKKKTEPKKKVKEKKQEKKEKKKLDEDAREVIKEIEDEIESETKEEEAEKKEEEEILEDVREELKEEREKEESKEKKILEEVSEKIGEVDGKKLEELVEEEEKETSSKELREELDEDKEKGFFFKIKKKLMMSVMKQEEFDEIFEDFEMTLLENNVALDVVDQIKKRLGEDLVNLEIKKKDIEKTIFESLKGAIDEVLKEPEKDLEKEIEKSLEPYVILFFGINGSGKTTSVAKLAYKLNDKGISCVMAAGDTFRAASIEQLETHAKKVGVPIIKGEYGGDPASVGFEAIKYAKSHKIKVVLIDTAGRMYTKKNLMKEMEKIVKVTKPKLKLFVGESITGNDATEQAKMFNETAGIDGIILTKADVDEKAGAILSVSQVSGKPIYFLGTGQEYKDLEEFKKDKVLSGLGLD